MNQLLHDAGGIPWRFRAADYLGALSGDRDGVDLEGAAVVASWDRELAATMQAHGRAVYEEEVLARLLEDLER